MKNVEKTIRALGNLRRRGVRILMDDFGSGGASIGYLRRLPIDVLKIDRTFIEPIDSSSSEAALVRAIIEMAHGLGLSVVAEGVARQRQLEVLGQYGCDEAQGFLLAPTLTADAAAELVASYNR